MVSDPSYADAITGRILGNESGGDPTATNPNSSAAGAGQFINSTWLATVGKYRPDLTEGKTPQEVLALRNDPQLSAEMTANYARENGQFLAQNGHPVTPGTTYLAHFAGPQGAAKVLGSDPAAPVSSVLGQAAVNANPFLRNMTAADLRAWADRKMGGGTGSGHGANNAPAASPAPPLNQNLPPPAFNQVPQAPPTGLPAYGWSPGQAAPQAADMGGGGTQAPQQTAPPQMQPLAGPRMARPNVTQFQALLANAPPSVRNLIFRG